MVEQLAVNPIEDTIRLTEWEKTYSVYVIKSEKYKRLYVGISKNIERRLKEHNIGCVFSTKGYRPWKLVFIEKVGVRSKAREKEKYFKSGCGKELLKKIIPG
jgi:putative endonuclease